MTIDVTPKIPLSIDHQGLLEIQDDMYHRVEAISKSGLDQISKSPAHYRAWLECPPEPTDAMVFGSLSHKLILEPEKFYETCVVAPECDRRTKAGKEVFEAFQSANDGKLVLRPDQYQTLKGMADSWRKHPLYEGTHKHSKFEVGAFWKRDGLQCKARPDIIHSDGLILDLKTTESARESEFQKTIFNFRYHVQAAWYLDGLSKATGLQFDQFLFIAIEKKPPYAVAVYLATPSMIATGRQTYIKDFETYRQCMERNEWPSYSTEVRSIDLPAWAN